MFIRLFPALPRCNPASLLESFDYRRTPTPLTPRTQLPYPWGAGATYNSCTTWYYGKFDSCRDMATFDLLSDALVSPGTSPEAAHACMATAVDLLTRVAKRIDTDIATDPRLALQYEMLVPSPSLVRYHIMKPKSGNPLKNLDNEPIDSPRVAMATRNRGQTRPFKMAVVMSDWCRLSRLFTEYPSVLIWPALGSAYVKCYSDITQPSEDAFTIGEWLAHNETMLRAVADGGVWAAVLPRDLSLFLADITVTMHLLMTFSKAKLGVGYSEPAEYRAAMVRAKDRDERGNERATDAELMEYASHRASKEELGALGWNMSARRKEQADQYAAMVRANDVSPEERARREVILNETARQFGVPTKVSASVPAEAPLPPSGVAPLRSGHLDHVPPPPVAPAPPVPAPVAAPDLTTEAGILAAGWVLGPTPRSTGHTRIQPFLDMEWTHEQMVEAGVLVRYDADGAVPDAQPYTPPADLASKWDD